jgi:sRNA-binding regulator protein Hfq
VKHFYNDVQTAIDCFDNCTGEKQKQVFKHALQTNVFKEKDI